MFTSFATLSFLSFFFFFFKPSVHVVRDNTCTFRSQIEGKESVNVDGVWA